MSRLNELIQELHACPGFSILVKIRSLSITRVMNERNLLDLQNALSNHAARAEGSGSPILGQLSDDESEIINVMRFLHNYLASSKTLIDHSRRIVKSLCEETPFYTEYGGRKNKCFVGNPLSHFVQDLRNFTLHRDIPLRGPTVARGLDGTISGYYKLDREALSGWNKWSAPSEQYLSGVEVELRLHEIVSAYDALVSEFYCWLERRLREVFECDIREEENLRHQIREQPKSERRTTG